MRRLVLALPLLALVAGPGALAQEPARVVFFEADSAPLDAAGIARGRITVGARGEVPFALVEQESRRVEIRVGS